MRKLIRLLNAIIARGFGWQNSVPEQAAERLRYEVIIPAPSDEVAAAD